MNTSARKYKVAPIPEISWLLSRHAKLPWWLQEEETNAINLPALTVEFGEKRPTDFFLCQLLPKRNYTLSAAQVRLQSQQAWLWRMEVVQRGSISPLGVIGICALVFSVFVSDQYTLGKQKPLSGSVDPSWQTGITGKVIEKN